VAILPIYLFDHPILRKKAKTIRELDDELRHQAADMMETMHRASGIGLAANQVGSLQRIIVVDVSGMDDAPGATPLVMVNPEVLSEEGRWVMEEGCLSIPDIREEVERAERIRVRFRDIDFRVQELDTEGLQARVILHEIDHLNGVLFFDRIGSVRRKLLRGRLNKVARGESETAYPVVLADGALKAESPLS
jgi:peptide deformylase